ncbi:MAG: hypothetical protein RXR08_11405 [Sulfolobaceae archaeon]
MSELDGGTSCITLVISLRLSLDTTDTLELFLFIAFIIGLQQTVTLPS